MKITVIAVIVIVGVVISIIRAQKIKQEREEEKKREEQRKRNDAQTQTAKRNTATSPRPTCVKPQTQKAKAADPFGDYGGPYTGQSQPLTLTPKQYGEWLTGFEENERAGVVQIKEEKGKSQFSRYLFEEGYSYRQTRKLRGYAPQNRLFAVPVAYKTKADDTVCAEPANPAQKIAAALPTKDGPAVYVQAQQCVFPVLSKKAANRRTQYESFYMRKPLG